MALSYVQQEETALWALARPKEFPLVPDQLFRAGPRAFAEAQQDFLEYSCLRSWVNQWLQYCRWYYQLSENYQCSIEDWFNGPVINRKWKADLTDPELVRLGLLWKCYNLVLERGVDGMVPILPHFSQSVTANRILGGEQEVFLCVL